jgi:opacity protein-like surface antigen
MKKTIAIAVLCTAMGSSAMAQQMTTPHEASSRHHQWPKFYLAVNGGYFFSVSPGEFPNVGPFGPYATSAYVDPSTGQQTSIISNKILTGSYGAGWRTGLTIGMDVSKFVSFEIAAHYFQSNRNLMTNQVWYEEGQTPSAATTILNLTSRGYVDDVDVAPAIVLNAGHKEGLNPYVRFGLVIPVYGRLKIHTDGMAAGETVIGGTPYLTEAVFHRDEEVKPNATLGFQGAFGVSYPLCHKLDVYVEAEYRNVPVVSKSKEVTKYNETDAVINPATGATVQTSTIGLSGLSTAERYTNYVTILTSSSNTPTDNPQTNLHPTYQNENAPSNDLKSYINIGGLGMNLGFKWRF